MGNKYMSKEGFRKSLMGLTVLVATVGGCAPRQNLSEADRFFLDTYTSKNVRKNYDSPAKNDKDKIGRAKEYYRGEIIKKIGPCAPWLP